MCKKLGEIMAGASPVVVRMMGVHEKRWLLVDMAPIFVCVPGLGSSSGQLQLWKVKIEDIIYAK